MDPGLAIQGGLLLFMLALGYFAGSYAERRHFQNLDRREAALGNFSVSQLKTFPDAIPGGQPPQLFVGEAVIATDYLKSFLSSLRKIFGGELRSYQSLLIRARREALLRIVEEASAKGYNSICNVRYETADVGGNSSSNRVATVAILASATAYQRSAPVAS